MGRIPRSTTKLRHNTLHLIIQCKANHLAGHSVFNDLNQYKLLCLQSPSRLAFTKAPQILLRVTP